MLFRSFSKSLQWFTALHNLAENHLRRKIDIARDTVLFAATPEEPPRPTNSQLVTPVGNSSNNPPVPSSPPSETDLPPDPTATYVRSNDSPTSTRASAYLWRRCPACFAREFRAETQKFVSLVVCSTSCAHDLPAQGNRTSSSASTPTSHKNVARTTRTVSETHLSFTPILFSSLKVSSKIWLLASNVEGPRVPQPQLIRLIVPPTTRRM